MVARWGRGGGVEEEEEVVVVVGKELEKRSSVSLHWR
jgi:hypothetical protein